MSAPRRENDDRRKVTFNTTDAGGHVKPISAADTEVRKFNEEFGDMQLRPTPKVIKIDSRKDNSRGGK